eukprot:4536520-Amphidinium_carterae.1
MSTLEALLWVLSCTFLELSCCDAVESSRLAGSLWCQVAFKLEGESEQTSTICLATVPIRE